MLVTVIWETRVIKLPNFVMDRDVLEAELDDGLGLVCILARVQHVG